MTTKSGGGRSSKRLCATAAISLLSVAILFLILGLTIFQPKHPITTVNSISITTLDFSSDPHFNVVMNTSVTVHNPNRVGFTYNNSTAIVRYRENNVGEAPIPAGAIGAGKSKDMNLAVTVMADRLLGESEFYGDVVSGVLKLETWIRMAGEVKVFFSVHVVSYSDCDLEIIVGSQSVVNQNCRYKTTL